MTVREIGTRVVARERGIDPADVPDADRIAAVVDLEHRCLPALSAGEWVRREEDRVVATKPWPLADTGLSLPDLRDPADPVWEPISRLLVRPRRRAVVAIVATRERALTVDDLADSLRDRGVPGRTTYPRDRRPLVSTLHHIDLPVLADTETVGYDPETGRLTAARLTEPVARRLDGELPDGVGL